MPSWCEEVDSGFLNLLVDVASERAQEATVGQSC